MKKRSRVEYIVAMRLLKLPMVKWASEFLEISPTNGDAVHATCRELDNIAVRAARAASYFGARMRGEKHEHAVREQNRVAVKVRRALGYTYADDLITF